MFQFPHLGSQWRSASHRVCWNLGSVHPRKQPKPICGPMGFLWIPALLRRLWVALRQLPLLLLGYRFILWGDKGLVSLYSENHKGHLPVWSILILCQPMSNHPQKHTLIYSLFWRLEECSFEYSNSNLTKKWSISLKWEHWWWTAWQRTAVVLTCSHELKVASRWEAV